MPTPARCGAAASRRPRRRRFHRAGIGPLDAHDQLHHGRLAGAVRADEPEDLAALDVKAYVLDRDQAAEALGQARDSRGGPAMLIPVAPRASSRGSRRERIARRQCHRGDHEGNRPAAAGIRSGTIRNICAEHGAEDGAPSAQHRRDDDLHPDRDVDYRVDGGRAHIKNQQRPRQPEKKALTKKAASSAWRR